MFQEIISKLKLKKQLLQEKDISDKEIEVKEEEVVFEITLSQEKNFYKMEISNYISMGNYCERMKEIDNLGVKSLMCNAVLWNDRLQKVNVGPYYAVVVEDRIYNFLVADDCLIVDERIQADDVIEEKILSLNLDKNDYSYAFHKHMIGNTFYTRFFNVTGLKFGKLDLTVEEFKDDVTSLINNLENIDNIEDVIDINFLSEFIFNNLEKKYNSKKSK